MPFKLIRTLIRILLAIFYRRVEVIGAERIPPEGPLILAANHHNSVVDAMILIAVAPRPLRTLAVATLFSHPLMGPFLRMIGALPVQRRQEAGDDPNKNDALFEATTTALRNGEAILIFPEGRTQPEPVLLELRTGTARMLLAAQDGSTSVTLLPVGLLFENPGSFREGRALVLVGEPVPLDSLSREEPARDLTDRLASALRGLILEAPDRETLGLVSLVESLQGVPPADSAARVVRLKTFLAGYHWLQEHAPLPLAQFGTRLSAFMGTMDEVGLPFPERPRTYSSKLVLAFAAREFLALLAGFPLALCGVAFHAIPFALTGWVVSLIPHTDEEEATDQISVGLLFYPLAWLAEGWLVMRAGGPIALLGFALLLVPSGFMAMSWRKRVNRVGREIRAFVRILRNPELPIQWMAQRRDLIEHLEALENLLPQPFSAESMGAEP